MSGTAAAVLADIHAELRGMRAEMRKDIGAVRAEITSLRIELRGEIGALRGE